VEEVARGRLAGAPTGAEQSRVVRADGDLIQQQRADGRHAEAEDGEDRPGDQRLGVVEEGDLEAEQPNANGEQGEVEHALLEDRQCGVGGVFEEEARQLAGEHGSEEEEAGGDDHRPRPRHRLFVLA
jgi:hypothetical protein